MIKTILLRTQTMAMGPCRCCDEFFEEIIKADYVTVNSETNLVVLKPIYVCAHCLNMIQTLPTGAELLKEEFLEESSWVTD